MKNIKFELTRLNENLSAVRNHADRMEELAFKQGMPCEYYEDISNQLISKIAHYRAFCYDYSQRHKNDPTGLINLSDETKRLHEELNTAYKDTASYFTELLAMVDRQKNSIMPESQNTQPKRADIGEIKKFEEYFTKIPSDIEGLKNYLKSLKIGKDLAYAIHYMENNGISAISTDRKKFVNTFNPTRKEVTNLNSALKNIIKDTTGDTKFKSIGNQVDKFM